MLPTRTPGLVRAAGTAACVVAALLIIPAASLGGTGGIGPGGSTGTAGPGTPAKGGTFPVRAAHTYGDGLGAGRGHQGQDILAKCGRPIVAATAGRVRIKDYQASGAGNYVVIKGGSGDFDYVYMHMLRNVVVSAGDRVRVGDPIGEVGSTGGSTACHLHFEMWTAPGWYRGGGITDPTPYLKRWDRSS